MPRKKKEKREIKGIFYRCPCEFEAIEFDEMLEHYEYDHECENLSSEIEYFIEEDRGHPLKYPVKFYWKLECLNCSKKTNQKKYFTSSLCNADVQVVDGDISLKKLYYLQCKICNSVANFCDEKYLKEEYLPNRATQKIVYRLFNDHFDFYDFDESKKRLQDHDMKRCEKCKSLGFFCGLGGDNQRLQQQKLIEQQQLEQRRQEQLRIQQTNTILEQQRKYKEEEIHNIFVILFSSKLFLILSHKFKYK